MSPEGRGPKTMGLPLPPLPHQITPRKDPEGNAFARTHRTENNNSLSAWNRATGGKFSLHAQKEGCQDQIQKEKSTYCFIFIKITK